MRYCAFFTLVVLCTFYPVQALDTILVIKPDVINTPAQPTFEKAIRGLKEGLEEECQIFDMVLPREPDLKMINDYIGVVNPDMIVLMDTKAINAYKTWIYKFPELAPFPPTILMMSPFVESELDQITNSMAIEFEVQGVTGLRAFRDLFTKDISKVGVIHRSEVTDFIHRQKELCKLEKIELVSVNIDKPGKKITSSRVRSTLRRLFRKEKVDAIWILNDNVLLTRDILSKAWIPTLNRYEVPTIVGLDRFVIEDQFSGFGQFGVVPDPFELGTLAAQTILDVRDQDWKIKDERLLPPISVFKYLNKRKLFSNQQASLNQNSLLQVDIVIH